MVSAVGAVAGGAQPVGLGAEVGHLGQAPGQVAAAQVGIGVAGDFAGHQALHELERGHIEREDGGVVGVVEGGGAGEV